MINVKSVISLKLIYIWYIFVANGLYKSILHFIELFCNTKIVDPFAFLFFDFRVTGKMRNVCAVVISTYISIVWSCRNENIEHNSIVRKFKNKLRYNIKTNLLCTILDNELENIFKDLDHRCENFIY